MSKKNSFFWFPLDAEAWLNSERVLCMSLAARGAYTHLLCREWRNGSLPNDSKMLAALVGVSESEFLPVWQELSDLFIPDSTGRLVNERLEADRQKQIAKVEQSRAAINTRWQNKRNTDVLPMNYDQESDSEDSVLSRDSVVSEGGMGETITLPTSSESANPQKPSESAIVPLRVVDAQVQEIQPGWKIGWWLASADVLAYEVMEAIRRVPKFVAANPEPPTKEAVERLIADTRRLAPNDEAIRQEIGKWLDYNQAQPKRGRQKNPLLSMRNWFGNCGGRWQAQRKAQQQPNSYISGGRARKESPTETYQRIQQELEAGA